MAREGEAADIPAAEHEGDATADHSSMPSDADPKLDRAWAAFPPTIGHYAIQGVIGTGGFGTVYRGMHRWLRVPGAIKVIQCEPSDRLRSDFRREAQRQARLQAHPGIAQVRDFGFFTDPRVGAKLPYYVMDLIPGNQSVTRYAHNAELSMNERLRLFAQVCDAVQYAHDRGILHLDLKPGNILVFPAAEGRPAQPKVIDFGIARAADPAMERRVRRGVSGTISYMSPEQTDASVPLDVRSDVYSLGVVLYELLTGWLPYEVGGRSEREAYRVVRDVPPDFDSPRAAKLPAAIRAILTRVLAKRVQDRYESVGSLAADVRTYLRGGMPAAAGAGLVARAVVGARSLIAGAPLLTTLLIVAMSIALTRYVGVPLINRWTPANVVYERNVLTPAFDAYERTRVIGWFDPKTRAEASTDGEVTMSRSAFRSRLADLLVRLNGRVRPAAVVLDYTIRNTSAEDTSDADRRIAVAAAELVKKGIPVIVGVREPGLAVRGSQPPEDELSGVVAQATGRWGHVRLHTKPRQLWEIMLLQWEAGSPEPRQSLSMVTINAIRGGSKTAGYGRDDENNLVRVTYFEDPAAAGGRPHVASGEPLTIRVSSVLPNDRDPSLTEATIIVPLPPQSAREAATMALPEVLADDQALARCENKVIVVGDISGRDSHPTLNEEVPGPYAHATVIEMLLRESPVARTPGRIGQWVILAAGALVGVALPVPVLRRRRWWPRWAVAGVSVLWLAALSGAVAAAVIAAKQFSYLFNPLVVVFAIVVAAALALGAGLIRSSHPMAQETHV